MTTFNLGGGAPRKAPTPEALFRDLKKPGGIVHLWAHQADLLRAYESRERNSPDVALELPTGSGKTLVGLLIAEWRRTTLEQRVAYLCPTRQLAQQTAAHADAYGIKSVTLIGSSAEWHPRDLAAFTSGGAVAVSVYSHIFNSSPKLQNANVLILDDAHSGEGYVAGAWTIRVEREESTLYRALLSTCSPGLDESFLRIASDDAADPVQRKYVRLVKPTFVSTVAEQLVEAIEEHGSQQRFPLSMLRHHLDRSMVYVSWRSIEIRPFIPPTFAHPAFADADQRVYMSATLGESGELERAFGRPIVRRLPVPPGWDRQGSGRRFFVFPDMGLLPSEVPDFAQDLIHEAGKAVVLCPNRVVMSGIESAYVPKTVPVQHAPDVENDLRTFSEANRAVLILTNRYDGIDLPDEACRLVVLAGLPVGTHLQERFIYESVGATIVLEERIRTRVVQGSGRCTRNANDYAVVMVIGPDLMNFCVQKEVREAMHPELQAETSFGVENSDAAYGDLLDRVRVFLRQDDEWIDQVEPMLHQRRDEATVSYATEVLALRGSARKEVHAADAAWRGDWSAAIQHVREVLESLAGNERLRPYKAFWAYLGASWASLAAATDPTFESVVAQLQDESQAIAKGLVWLAKLESRFTPNDGDMESSDLLRIDRAVDEIIRVGWGSRRFEHRVTLIESGIEGTESTPFEVAMKEIGLLLGFDADRFDEQGDPDGVWRSGEELWVALEAKSEESAGGEISLGSVRQANTHLRWAERHFRQPAPPGSFTVIVSARDSFASDARELADDNVYATSLDAMRELGSAAVAAWREVRAVGRGKDREELATLVRQSFHSHALLSHRLRSRLRRLRATRR
jgi:DEAD/DEAH box helicase/Helicase C-terminal domain